MTQSELNQAVAQATGETTAEIAHRGFSFWDPSLEPAEDELTAESFVETTQVPGTE